MLGLNDTHWMPIPEKLSESETFQTAKKEIKERIMPFKKWKASGQTGYLGECLSQEKSDNIESLHFVIYLLKENIVCCLSFGEHKFPDNELFQSVFGNAGYTITFQPLQDYFFLLAKEISELKKNVKRDK
ncbi:MAG: hypothetical protein HYW70_01255 [Candidatus Nealsonbacteria bacterium]|nr:hypothetical protein [Candidatus Nealsonbacteria bacterium]